MRDIFITLITETGKEIESLSPFKVDKSLSDSQITELVDKQFERLGIEAKWR